MTEIQPHATANHDEYPYWVSDGMDQGEHSIYANVTLWLRSPRRWKDRNLKRYKNIRQSAGKFKQTLDGFTPADLRDDLLYSEFIDSLQNDIASSNLAQSTLDGYLGYMTGKVLVYGGVDARIVEEVKTQISIIKKGLKKRKEENRGIEESDIVELMRSIDEMCENSEEAPNLSRIANPNSSNAKSERTSHHLLLALRAYACLTLVSAGRANSIRRIRISDVSEDHFIREISKMRTYSEEIRNSMPEWAFARVEPYLEHCRENHPDAVFLFSEDEGKRGRGTINPKTLGELVKGSMRNIGMRPTCSGGYYRFHDLRKVWCDWMDKGGASLEQMSAFLGHSSAKVTFQHYFSEDHKRRLGQEGWEAGMGELEALIQQRERIDHSIDELYRQLHDIGFFSDGKGGGVYPACWDEDDDMLVRAPGLEPGTP
jgi:integrase